MTQAITAPVEYAVGDEAESYEVEITKDGAALDITGWTFYLKVRARGATENKFTKTVTAVSSASGVITNAVGTTATPAKVRFDWVTGDWSAAGIYEGEISYLNASSKPGTYAASKQEFVIIDQF